MGAGSLRKTVGSSHASSKPVAMLPSNAMWQRLQSPGILISLHAILPLLSTESLSKWDVAFSHEHERARTTSPPYPSCNVLTDGGLDQRATR
jgi:hypothetical protein